MESIALLLLANQLIIRSYSVRVGSHQSGWSVTGMGGGRTALLWTPFDDLNNVIVIRHAGGDKQTQQTIQLSIRRERNAPQRLSRDKRTFRQI